MGYRCIPVSDGLLHAAVLGVALGAASCFFHDTGISLENDPPAIYFAETPWFVDSTIVRSINRLDEPVCTLSFNDRNDSIFTMRDTGGASRFVFTQVDTGLVRKRVAIRYDGTRVGGPFTGAWSIRDEQRAEFVVPYMLTVCYRDSFRLTGSPAWDLYTATDTVASAPQLQYVVPFSGGIQFNVNAQQNPVFPKRVGLVGRFGLVGDDSISVRYLMIGQLGGPGYRIEFFMARTRNPVLAGEYAGIVLRANPIAGNLLALLNVNGQEVDQITTTRGFISGRMYLMRRGNMVSVKIHPENIPASIPVGSTRLNPFVTGDTLYVHLRMSLSAFDSDSARSCNWYDFTVNEGEMSL